MILQLRDVDPRDVDPIDARAHAEYLCWRAFTAELNPFESVRARAARNYFLMRGYAL